MINLQRALSPQAPDSTLLAENEAYIALEGAMMKKDIKGVSEALGKIKLEQNYEREHVVRNACIMSDWPQGFETVVKHFEFTKTEQGDYDLYGEKLLWMCLERGALNLVKHLWWKSSDEAKVYCLKERTIDLQTAQVLVQVGVGATLIAMDDSVENQLMLSRLMKKSVEYLNEVEKRGESENENVEATEEIVKLLLNRNGTKMIKCFWQEVCIVDNIELLKRLVDTGIVGPKVQQIEEAPSEFTGNADRLSVRQKRRIPNWVLKESPDGEQGIPNLGQETYKFNTADMVCWYSQGALNILSQLIRDKSFQKELFASPFAKHVFVCTASQSSWGVGLWDELKVQGVNIDEIRGDSGQNSLHMAVKTGGPTQFETIEELARVYPKWMESKDDAGKTPFDWVDKASMEEVKPMLEGLIIKGVLNKKAADTASPESSVQEEVGKKYRV